MCFYEKAELNGWLCKKIDIASTEVDIYRRKVDIKLVIYLSGTCCVLAMDLLRLTTKQVSFFARKNLLLLPVDGKEYF